jgi:nucleoid-associated protein YgaU
MTVPLTSLPFGIKKEEHPKLMTNSPQDKQDLPNFTNFNQKKSKRYLTLSLSLLAAGILLLMSIQFLKDQGSSLSMSGDPLASEINEDVSFSQLKDLSEQQKTDLDVLFRKIQAQENYISELENKLSKSPKSSDAPVVSEGDVINQALKDKNSSLQVRLSQSQNDLMSTKLALDTLKHNFDKEVDTKNHSFSEMQSLALNLEDQTKKLQEQAAYSQSLEEQLKQQMSQNTDLEKRADSESSENASIKVKNETLQHELTEKSSRALAAEELLEKILADFKTQAQELDEKNNSLASLETKNQTFNEEVAQIRLQLNQFKDSTGAQTQILSQEKEDVSNKLFSSEQELSMLKSELEATVLKRREDIQQAESILGNLSQVQQEVNTKQIELDKLQTSLTEEQGKSLQLTREVTRLSELELAYEKEKVLRQQQEKHFTALAGNLEEQRNSLQKLLESKEYLKKEYEALKTDHLELLRKIASEGSSQSKTLAVNTYIPDTQSRKVHTITRGDTLTGISMEYYGTTKKWRSIYDANKDTVTDINRLKVGSNLIIP